MTTYVRMTARERETLDVLKRELRASGGQSIGFETNQSAASVAPPDEASRMMLPVSLTERFQNRRRAVADDIAEQGALADIRRGRLAAEYGARMRSNSLSAETDQEPILSVSAQIVELAARRRDASNVRGR